MKIIEDKKSPNFSSRRTYEPNVIVIHKTLGLMPGTLNWLMKPEAQVSTHYLVTKKGEIYHLVDDKQAAWHAGRIHSPSARATKVMLKDSGGWVNPNRYTIGIENEALLEDEWTTSQIDSLVWLVNHLAESNENSFNGEPDRIITHRDLTSYKPNLDAWLEVILKRLKSPMEPIPNKMDDIKKVLAEAEGLAQKLLAKIEDIETML
jgi:N-acetylmuramoyl-L-alanine amidase